MLITISMHGPDLMNRTSMYIVNVSDMQARCVMKHRADSVLRGRTSAQEKRKETKIEDEGMRRRGRGRGVCCR